MKIILLSALLFITVPSFTCKEDEASCIYVESFSPLERQVLSNYVEDAYQKNFIRNGKGIVHLTISKGANGMPEWYLSTHVDDVYKESPPAKWAMVYNEMILISDESKSDRSLDSAVVKSRIECLEELIGNRVYQRSKRKRKGFTFDSKGIRIMENEGKPKMREIPDPLIFGNLYNEMIVTFEKNGTFKLQIPV